MYRYLLRGVICLLAGSVHAQGANDAPASVPAPAKPVISMEEPLPGDFWTYELRDEISGSVKAVRNNMVTEVTATEISVRFNIQGKPEEGLNVYDRSWNLKSAAPWKYTPHDGSGIQSPLKGGASWKSEGDDINNSNGNIWKRSGRSKVVGQETVTTKAGTFETIKIETIVNRRPTNDPTRKMEIIQQTWYAPAIDHWVKRTQIGRGNGNLIFNNTLELVEYGRKK
jgi:uncharacterized protein DUF3108